MRAKSETVGTSKIPSVHQSGKSSQLDFKKGLFSGRPRYALTLQQVLLFSGCQVILAKDISEARHAGT
jgi:hypothetical protein